MNILYTTEYSNPNICGVWNRTLNEARYMKKKGHKVFVLSTNIKKEGGSLEDYELFEDIPIFRFRPWLRISDNASFWYGQKFKKKALELKPDIIICNTYRHPETNFCLKIAKQLNIPCILITHASFLEPGIRGVALSASAWLYDRLFCRLNEFDRVFAISNWELPYLQKLGAKEVTYVPNALPDELFNNKVLPFKNNKKILFLGRIVPIKDIPTLLKAIEKLNVASLIYKGSKKGSKKDKKDHNYSLTLAGPFDKEYRAYLVKGMEELGIQDQTCFVGSIDSLKDKIEIIDQHDIFILPSKREGMPTALLEAMARGKICIASKTQGAKEIIINGKNGFLFDIGNEQQLSQLIRGVDIFKKMNIGLIEDISTNARKTAEQFAASHIYPETERIYLSLISNNTKPKGI